MSKQSWTVVEEISRRMNIPLKTAQAIQDMLDVGEFTIPFITRYRRESTNCMDADKLRQFQNLLNDLRKVQQRAASSLKQIRKQGKLDKTVENLMNSAKTIEEIDAIYEPFKGLAKRSLAQRAIDLGLESMAKKLIIKPNTPLNMAQMINKEIKGLQTISDIETGLKHLLADHFSKDSFTIKKLQLYFSPNDFTIFTKKSVKLKDAASGQQKYQDYYDGKFFVNKIQPHQVLAINRGETQKELSVRIVIAAKTENDFRKLMKKHYASGHHIKDIVVLIHESIDDSFNRLIKRRLIRQVRSDLTKKALEDSVQLFSKNLKKLLLTPPVKDKTVLGVDPGFSHGCKCAVLSSNGQLQATEVFYLRRPDEALKKIKDLYKKCSFEIIAIGNGTACRETEIFFANFIRETDNKDLKFCIVSENGASCYSVADTAKEEFPDLDCNLISAISIGRRLLDPLSELIKIQPKHLGIGQYQHDVSNSKLNKKLSGVVEDCVTCVGVDLNSASPHLLYRIAGLKSNQVKNIIEYRNKKGPFINRMQLKSVPGVGEKTFEQCVGFLRISQPDEERIKSKENVMKGNRKRGPENNHDVKVKKAKYSNKLNVNPLDRTWIHPETYAATEKFLKMNELSLDNLSSSSFIKTLKENVGRGRLQEFADTLGIGLPTMSFIYEGLTQPKGYIDIRETVDFRMRLYRRDVVNIKDLRKRMQLRGRVTNVTGFGVFLDIGVGVEGLMHMKNTKGKWSSLKDDIGPNDVIIVEVMKIEYERKRISLGLVEANIKSIRL